MLPGLIRSSAAGLSKVFESRLRVLTGSGFLQGYLVA